MNWMVEQTVTVEVSEDDDAIDENVIIYHDVAGYGGVTRAQSVEFTLDDNDVPGLALSGSRVQEVDEGSSVTYTIRLTSAPTGEVTVTPRSDNADATFTPAKLIFDQTNWKREQTVTVQLAEDGDVDDEAVIIYHDVVGYGEVTRAADFGWTLRDNDSRGVSLSRTALTIAEGSSETYEIALDATPTIDVTVTPRSDNPDVTLSPADLTFTPDNWNTPQTVTVRAGEDEDADDEGATIAHEVANYAEVTVGGTVAVTVRDNDATGDASSPIDIDVIVGGVVTGTVASEGPDLSLRNDWYRFTLPTERTLRLVLSELSADADLCLYEGSVDIAAVEEAGKCHDNRSYSGLLASSTLEGAASDTVPRWSLGSGTYLVRVDGYADGPTGYRLAYGTLAPPEVNLSTTALVVSRGSTVTYTVVLTNEPSRNVTVVPEPANTNSGVTVSPATLTFTSSNWDMAQTITVSAAEDAEPTTIGHAVSGLLLDEDAPTDGGRVEISIADNPGVILSDTALTIDEGVQGIYMLNLATAPDGDVTVTPRSANPHIEFTPTSLSFDSDNWNTPQQMSFSIEEENQSPSVTIQHDVSGYGDLTEGGVVTVSVVQPLAEPDSERRQAAERTVAAVAAAAVSNVTSNIGARFSAPSTGGASISLAGTQVAFGHGNPRSVRGTSLSSQRGLSDEDSWQWRSRSLTSEELLGSSSFEIALGASQGSNGNPTDVGPQVTVWGRGDFQVFESGGGQNSGYDGDLVAGYLGADFNTGGSWLVGMALSRIKAEADYTLGSAGGGGTLEAELTNLHPYARFALDDRSEAWTILGLGKGEVTDSAQGGSTSMSDLSMQMMSAGARHLLNSFIGIDWALLGDGSLAKVNTGDGVEAVDGISASVWRVRAGVEASYTSVWEGGSALTTFLEIAGRQDGGASAEGRGLELSPGLAFSDPESGFSIEARGRALVLHSADNHREYGASLTASLAPDSDGTGLSLAMTPTWGTPTNSLDSVDGSLFHHEVVGGRADSLSLNSRVAYGFAAGSGVLSPFAEFSLHDSDSHRTRVGSRYSLGPSVDLELSGDRASDGTGSAEHSVQFRTRIGF